MEHSNTIINDLTIVIVCAATVSVLFKALRLPSMMGYLLSGLLIGPNLFAQSPIHDLETIQDLKELGVAFLMFYIGLEFDLKKLQKMFGSAVLAVTFQTAGMIILGMLTAPVLGWSSMEGLFIGCLLAISSTMITVPILKSQDAVKSHYGQIAIGILILEDILAILILVVLSGVGVTGKFEWDRAWQAIFLVGVFVVMVFFLGKLLAPKLLKLLKRFGNDEMTTVVSAALLLGIGLLAEHFNFSIALGAFLAGSILSQSELAHSIENAIEPLKNLFTAVFFVTIGILIEPALLAQYWLPIVLLTVLVVVGKTIATWSGLFLSGEKPLPAFKAAMCKAQIGEFSFIIAALGQKEGVTDGGVMTLAVGVALGTILVVPPLSGNAIRIFDWIAKRLPQSLKQGGVFYRNFLSTAKEDVGNIAFLNLVKRPLAQIVAYFLLFNGVLIATYLAATYVEDIPKVENWIGIIKVGIWVLGGIICLPFLTATLRSLEVIILLTTESVFSNRATRIFQRGTLRNVLNRVLMTILVVIFGGFYLSAAAAFLPSGVALTAFIGLICILSIILWRNIVRVNSRLENLFMQSFSVEMKAEIETRREQALKEFQERYSWPIELYDIEIKPKTFASGARLQDLGLRETSGVTVVGISRQNVTSYDPGPDVPLFPGDHLILTGTEEQITSAREILSSSPEEKVGAKPRGKFQIDQVYLASDSPFVGLTIAESNFRRRFHITVVGIQRGENRIYNPKPDEIIKADDILVVVGHTRTIEEFKTAADISLGNSSKE